MTPAPSPRAPHPPRPPRPERALTDLPISIGGTDVSVTVGDPTVTVGELVTAIGGQTTTGRRSVLVDGREIPAFTPLVVAALRPGEVVDGAAHTQRGAEGSLLVAVTAGVDAGSSVALLPGTDVIVGRGSASTLRLHSNGVSTTHCRLRLTPDGQLLIADAGSRNGTAVAGRGVGADFEPLPLGEAIRCGPAVLTVRPVLSPDTPRSTVKALTSATSGSVPYYRSPIDQIDPETASIALPIGPRRGRAARLGLLSLLLPVGMGVAMVEITHNYLYALFVLMSPALMLLNFIDRKVRGRRTGKRSKRRFRAELVDFRAELADATAAEIARRRHVFPDAVELARRSEEASARLWERRRDHPEFMVLTVAIADVSWSPPVPPLTEDLPAVEDAIDEASKLAMAPLTIPLRAGALVGLAGSKEGSRQATLAEARSLVMQATVLHGPAELRLLVVCTPATAADWEWVKWLPHVQPTFAGGRLLVASDDPDTLAIDELLADAGTSAALLAVVDTEGSGDNGDAAIRRLFRSGSSAISGLVIAPGIDALPDRCDVVIEHHDVIGEITVRWPREGGRTVDGIGTGVGALLAERTARALSRLHDPEAPSGTAALPALVGLADVVGLTGANASEVTARWEALTVPLSPVEIGLGRDGSVVVDLDRSGPHMAVIGGRGAGKTEALATLIVSLAAANPPDRLHLLLWGESFAHLRRLPHTAGFLGRIDDDSLRKFSESLDRELTRREQARTIANQAGDPGQAEARLVVFIDDVDTLLRTQPRSGDDLIRLFRRARGSGIHIVWSTSRAGGGLLSDFVDLAPLRLVLRLTSNQDSIDVMGSDVAARLERSLPGRGYVLAGRGEPRHLQTASVSSPTPRPQGRFEVRPFDLKTARDLRNAPDGPPDERVIVGLVSAAGTAYQRPGDLFSTAASAVGVLRSPGLPDLLGITDIDTFDPLETWKYGQGDQLLRVPIGVDAQLRPVVLDLKESALAGMGPHGLLVGATGSGKSELLRTLVTGLAVTHTPELLSLVLVDFKGGANFAAMAHLPHVAGMVTNLADDLALVDRVLAALEGELRRRQALLAAAGNLASAREYRMRYENGTIAGSGPGVGEPLPELLVIVDEFAELLDSQPDFLTFFLTIGRVGRSLGIHLLLASQRLEEGKLKGLDTYLSYRIGLRTFSAIESRTVLGVPDAYTLPTAPGGGYLKVGTDSFERFQASYVSGAHTPASGVEVITTGDEGPSVMSTMVDRLLLAPVDPVHQIWFPPLPAALTLDSLFDNSFVHDPDRGFTASTWGGTGQLLVPVGLVDEPDLQRQTPLIIDFGGPQGNLVLVGAPQTGKSTFIRSAVLSLAVTHTPLEAQVYLIDMGGGTLEPLSGLPQVGAVAGRLESEKVRRLVSHVEGMLNARERLFRDRAIDGMGEFRRLRDSGSLESGSAADVVVIIDGWAGFKTAHEHLEPVIADLATRGLGYGLHVMITANRWTEIRANVLDSFGGRLELRLNAPADSVVDRRKSATIRDKQNGRGLHPAKRFFQVALPRLDAVAGDELLQAALKVAVEHVATRWEGPVAPVVKLLPAEVTSADIPPDVPGVVMGLIEDDLAAWVLDLGGAEPHFVVYGDGETGKTTFLRTLLRSLAAEHDREQAELICVDYRRGLLEALPDGRLLGYAGSEPAVKLQVEQLLGVLASRQPGPEVTAAQLRDRSWWTGPEYYVVVDDYDLVVTASGSPLAPLVPMLAQGRELGFHLVIARRVAGAARSGFEPIIARIKEISPAGFVMAGDRNEGPLLGGVRAGEHIPGRGVLVSRRHQPKIAQVLNTVELTPADSEASPGTH